MSVYVVCVELINYTVVNLSSVITQTAAKLRYFSHVIRFFSSKFWLSICRLVVISHGALTPVRNVHCNCTDHHVEINNLN
jgi:hypothetical protein